MSLRTNPVTGQLDLVGAASTPTSPGGADGDLQFNDDGSFAGFGSYNSGTDLLTLTGGLAVNELDVTLGATIGGLAEVLDLNVLDDAQVVGDLDVGGETTLDGLGVEGTTVLNGETSLTGGQVTFEATAPALFSGKLRLNSANMALANGDNDAVTNPNAPYVKITGPDAAFAIRGITPGANAHGQLMVLLNRTGQAMTLTHEAGGAASSQLSTTTGADIVTTGNGMAILVYDVDLGKWLVVATSL